MKTLYLLIIFILISFFNNIYAKTIKNLIVFLGFNQERKAVIIIVETSRKELGIENKTEISIKLKYLYGNKIQDLYSDIYISDTPIDKFGFKKNILINILEQNQIEIGTSGLPYNFNIISLAQKTRATHQHTVNDIKYKYYINTAFFGKEGPPQKGSILFLEAESKKDNFTLPDILFVTDNLHKSWFLTKLSNNTSAVIFSDSADFFKTATNYKEVDKTVAVNMEEGVTYNKSSNISIPQLKHTLELNTRSEVEESLSQSQKGVRIYAFLEGYSQTKDGMTSIFGVRILNKKK